MVGSRWARSRQHSATLPGTRVSQRRRRGSNNHPVDRQGRHRPARIGFGWLSDAGRFSNPLGKMLEPVFYVGRLAAKGERPAVEGCLVDAYRD